MVEINDGLITLTLAPETAATLARACKIAFPHVEGVEAQLIAVYGAMFTAATIAATCQQNMRMGDDENARQFVVELLGTGASQCHAS